MGEVGFWQEVSLVLQRRGFHRIFIIFLFIYYSVVYYFGEIVNLAGWEALRWDFFYSVHDVHRLFFLIPIIYASYVFRIKWGLLTLLASFVVFLPRAIFVSPFADPVTRMVVFIIVACIVAIITGIAANEYERRNRLEALIKIERDKLLGILERMEDGVFLVGPDYRIRFINPSMVREFGEGTGSYCYDYLKRSSGLCDRVCRLPDVIQGKTERWEYTFPDDRTYEVIASPFTDSDGQTCQLATFRNITQRKKVERELVELNQLKSDLLSNVSHELRSPLTSIKGIVSSLMQKDIDLDNTTREAFLTGISEETDRLSSLVTNLLNMSRLEAGVWKPEKERCYISDIINDVIERQKWIQKKYTFETNLEPELPEIYADYNQIKQVIINLVENAVAYSNEGTRITVLVRSVNGTVEVNVSDQGAGIPKEDLDNIFDKFFRGSQQRRAPGGTGLGLAVSKSIIIAHGGRIWAESQLGHGSTFYFRLPVLQPDNYE